MRQLQVTVPKKFKSDTEDILEGYSSDISSSEVEKDDRKAVEFTVSVESEDIDELTEELKDIEDLESGELSIRVQEQESLIKKGQKTKGSGSALSQEELYSKAQEAAVFNNAQWGLIAVASAIAAYGLALDNVIVVVGAMMLAPILAPLVSNTISLVVGDRSLMKDSLFSGGISVLVVIAVSFIAVTPFPVGMNSTLEMVVSSSVLGVLLSLLVGSAAALSFATGYRDQIAGVAVAIAIVPPLAAVGIGLNMQNFLLSVQAATVASMNILAVLVSGFLTFKILGLKPSTYYRQEQAEKMKYVVPAALILFGLLAAPLIYSSYNSYQEHVSQQEVRDVAEDFFGEDLLEVRVDGSSMTIIVMGEQDTEKFRTQLSAEQEVEIRQLSTE